MKIGSEEIREILKYDPQTGDFTWKKKTSIRTRVGDVAGTVASIGGRDCIQIGIKRRVYLAHRLAVLYMTGKHPTTKITHLDGDTKNNRWSNLIEGPRPKKA